MVKNYPKHQAKCVQLNGKTLQVLKRSLDIMGIIYMKLHNRIMYFDELGAKTEN